MRSSRARGAVALAAVAAIVVLFVVLAGGGDDDGSGNGGATETQAQAPAGPTGAQGSEGGEPEPARPAPRIVVAGGKPRGGVRRLTFEQGDRIRFVVKSDVADEVHVHGYDIRRDVAAGGSVRFGFPARLEGVFEVELEGMHEQIAELRVNP